MKSLESYFANDVVLPEAPVARGDALTGSERAFLEKYVGAGWEDSQTGRAIARPVEPSRVMGGGAAAEPGGPDGQDVTDVHGLDGAELESRLMAEAELRLVSFYVGDQLFAAPIMLVQEVLRAVAPTKLPAAPDFLAGVTNLRGRVTPLVDLAVLLDVDKTGGQDGFLIVCRLRDMQIGLMVRSLDTMYKAPQSDMEWNIESQIGVSADLVSGLYKAQDGLVKILSVSRLFQKVLKS